MQKPNGRYQSLSQQAYNHIRHKIISLELGPGAVIDEQRLRDELALGRTPIREALQQLAREKLVNIVPRRGMFVTEIALTDLARLFEMRIELEGLATRLATQRGTAVHWDEMAHVLANLPDPSAPNSDWIAVDERCHQIIYAAADNPFLKDTLLTLYTLSLRLWHYALSDIGDMQEALLQHHAMLAAMRQGQADRAEQLMETHVKAFQEEIHTAIFETASAKPAD